MIFAGDVVPVKEKGCLFSNVGGRNLAVIKQADETMDVLAALWDHGLLKSLS